MVYYFRCMHKFPRNKPLHWLGKHWTTNQQTTNYIIIVDLPVPCMVCFANLRIHNIYCTCILYVRACHTHTHSHIYIYTNITLIYCILQIHNLSGNWTAGCKCILMYSQVSAGNFSQKSTSSWSCYIFDTLRIRMMHQVASNIRSRKDFGMGMGRNFNVIIPTGEVEPSLMFSSIATLKWRSICETKAAEIEMLLFEALSECAVQVSLSANINLSSATSYDLNINVKGTPPGDGMENHDSEEIIIK